MSPARPTPAEPAPPAGRRARPDRARHRWVALLLVLAALFGAGTAAALPVAETRAAAAAPAQDPGGETHDPAGTEAGLPGRARRHGTRPRPGRPRPRAHGPRGHRRPASAPVPAPRGDALRCVVMRC
ncbi:hypothetical protein PUR59_18590 [Streptomyces sp. SP18ES09]|uniref:hypothetical protein n=1 Tax=Streptomyces sp. SP18ES09 TaxID=3002532 RepID=UPI002E79E7F4|nr:hypothetical protein [Streptomyces sp. SP18ES09]MEE1817015.1 hypothetical protein [Streptomyces sp. SP18ES09]